MSGIDWSKAPEGATHCLPEDGRRNIWRRRSPYNQQAWEAWVDGEWLAVAPCVRSEDYLARPAAEWDGHGTPPVGTVCEYRHVHEWQKVEVFAVKPNYNGSQTALFTYENGTWCGCAEPSFFRPIRTPEQIAAEERAAAIEEMWSIYWKPEPQTAKEALGLLWDAGYRRQEAP